METAFFLFTYVNKESGLLLYDSLCRTDTCACSALYTGISVDHILAVSLRNCLYRALSCACSAAYTLVGNYICHVLFLLLFFRLATYVFDLCRHPFRWKRGRLSGTNHILNDCIRKYKYYFSYNPAGGLHSVPPWYYNRLCHRNRNDQGGINI